ncbi:MAG: carboxypeptidase regulatory-like domain-containing protein [Acidobacteria bacterium]|nr:carboxypeptidase regulatory-like domain-containing protein [Acidobacteriota bacterium]
MLRVLPVLRLFPVAMMPVCALVAQTTDGSLTSLITDVSEAVISGAAVTARNTATGVVTRTTSNESGVYTFPALQPGAYTVTAELEGFRRAQSALVLEVGARLAVNLQLQIGSLAETVEVHAASEALSTVSNSIGNVITGQKILDLDFHFGSPGPRQYTPTPHSRAGFDQNPLSEGGPVPADGFFRPSHKNEN